MQETFYAELMDNPTDKLFYKLIQNNQSSAAKVAHSMLMNGTELKDSRSQCGSFTSYYEDLAAPKNHPNFSQEYLDSATLQEAAIEEITRLKPDELIPIDEEVFLAIKSLNSGKAADELELTAEHLKYSDRVALPIIVEIFNEILRTKKVPEQFESGIINPIHKKGKDPRHFENYRGITISSILGKLLESVILKRLHQLNAGQSELQYGFTKGLSPTMASLLLSEAALDSRLSNRPLYVATLDTQKAFDVVSHPVLMVKLYEQGINSHLWRLIRSMYSGLTAKVEWEGEVSSSFSSIRQGVQQGGILSTNFYKTYSNDLQLELEDRCLGKFIGPNYTGCPTVADDVLLLSEDGEELQLMFNLSYIKSEEKRNHIHPQKSVVVRKNMTRAKLNQEVISEWKLGSTSVNAKSETVHLGLIRSEKIENNINISDRISLTRRTLYALIKAGVHGSNGLNPKVSYRIYQAYVLPRLFFNLETLHLNKTQLNQLQRFHMGLAARKPVFGGLRATQAQTSLRIRAV